MSCCDDSSEVYFNLSSFGLHNFGEMTVFVYKSKWEKIRNVYLGSSSQILEKEMAAHSSTIAWRSPGMGEPGWLPSMGSHRVGHD